MKTIKYDVSNIRKKAISEMDVYDNTNHMTYITNIIYDISFAHRHYIETEIKTKLSSYKQQDKNKRKYNEDLYISYDCLLHKIKDSNLKCYYCKKDMLLVYNTKKNKRQWSLERFDNSKGHYSDNTCICCLYCNLKRRDSNHEYYKLYKTIDVKKS